MITRPAIASRIAAFFDIDGTLLPAPSLERRFFGNLRRSRAIPPTNYLRWLTRAAQLAPSGLATIAHCQQNVSSQRPDEFSWWHGHSWRCSYEFKRGASSSGNLRANLCRFCLMPFRKPRGMARWATPSCS